MELSQQVCTLEQSNRLKELGVTQDGATFYWMPPKNGSHGEYVQYGWSSNALAPAFTVAELEAMLPFACEGRKDAVKGDMGTIYGYSCVYERYKHEYYHLEFALTGAQARAAMLINLLENNLITADEINARL